jgi:cytochrome c biogenesis protein ResB
MALELTMPTTTETDLPWLSSVNHPLRSEGSTLYFY